VSFLDFIGYLQFIFYAVKAFIARKQSATGRLKRYEYVPMRIKIIHPISRNVKAK